MIMEMEKEMKYLTPEVEALEVTVEVGFAGTGDVDPGMPDIDEP